jgi:hypothetical protein
LNHGNGHIFLDGTCKKLNIVVNWFLKRPSGLQGGPFLTFQPLKLGVGAPTAAVRLLEDIQSRLAWGTVKKLILII